MMRYSVCAVVVILSSASSLLADQPIPPAPAAPAPATPGAPSDGPRIKFDKDVFDAGKVPAGQALPHTFIFTNTGNQTLEVTKVNPTCGCTVAGTWTKTVEPGQTGTIPISVNVNPQWNGSMMKTLTVESNDKSRPGPASISIQFTVWKPIEISQPYGVTLSVPPEMTNEVSTVVRLDNNTDQPVDIYDVKSSVPAISVQVKTNEVGKHYEMVVSAKPPFKQGNNPSGQISGKTTSTNMPTFNLAATAYIQPIISIMPPHVSLEAAPFTNVIQKPVTIHYLGSTPIQVSNAVFSAKGVDVQLAEPQHGKIFTVTLSFPPGFDANGRVMELTLNSSSAQMPVIKVPVTQVPRTVNSNPASKSTPGVAPQAGIQVR